MILETAALVRVNRAPTDADIDVALGAHVCRCGTYDRLRQAVKLAAGYARDVKDVKDARGVKR